MSDGARTSDPETILRDAAQRVSVQVRVRRSEYYALRALTWGVSLAVLPLLLKGLLGARAPSLAIAVIGLALLGGLLYSLSRSVPAGDALRLADRAAALHDRLSTALECVERRDDSPLARALIADAVERAPRVQWSRMVPRRWPREARLLPVSAIALLALLFLPPIPIPRGGLPAWERSTPEAPEEPKQTGPATALDRPLEQKRRTPERVDRQPQELPRRPTRPETARGDLAAIFKDTTISQKRPDFSSFLKQGDERLRVLERVENLPDLKSDFTQSPQKMMFRKMQQLLAGLRPDQLSPERLRQLLDEMDRLGRKGDGSDGDLREGEEALNEGQLSRALSAMERALNRMRAQEERERAKKGLSGGRDKGREPGDPGKDGEGDDLGEGEGSLPGKGHSADVRGSPTRRLPGEKLDMALSGEQRQGRREAYDTNLRGRGAQNPSRLPFATVFSQYRKLMEEALAKEPIPFEYRTQIRDYFQSLEER
ncbi:MAG: hypothetical protein HYS14_04655 [Candidatus Rokubacteria bacterium]|nr:hypothetical protein [Candidatus Rokubacteria bacterium]